MSCANHDPWLSTVRPDAGNVQRHPVKRVARGHVQRAAVRVAPGEVVGMLRRLDGAEVLPFRGQDPEAPRTGDVNIALLIDLDAVYGVLARRAGHIDEDLS